MRQIEIIPFDLTRHSGSVMAVMAAALGLGDSGRQERNWVMRRHAERAGLVTRGAFTSNGLVGFCYGFPSDDTAWWEQQIRPHLVDAGTAGWLDDGAFELTELHVDPRHHGAGLGRRLITEVLSATDLPRALLSVRAGESPARRLYTSLGFRELTAPFQFGPSQPRYVVMGAPLPVRPRLDRPTRSACAEQR